MIFSANTCNLVIIQYRQIRQQIIDFSITERLEYIRITRVIMQSFSNTEFLDLCCYINTVLPGKLRDIHVCFAR